MPIQKSPVSPEKWRLPGITVLLSRIREKPHMVHAKNAFSRDFSEQPPLHSCKPIFKGGRPKRTRKICHDAMRHPAICFTQVFSRIVRANHEKSLPRVLHIQILWRFVFRNRKTVLEISQHLLSCFTQPFFQNGRAVREKSSRTSSIFRFFSRMISLAPVEEGTVQPTSYNSVFSRKSQGDVMKKFTPLHSESNNR